MPEITPILAPGTITLEARTMKSQPRLTQEAPSPTPAQPTAILDTKESKPLPTGSDKEEQDKKILRARLQQERIKQQMLQERKQMEIERRDLDLQKANSRKWQEAAELAAQGRFVEATEKAGVSYDQLTQQILNGGQIPPKQIAEQTASELVKREMKAFEERQQEHNKKSTETQLAEAKRIMFNEAKHLIDNSEQYPLAKDAEAYQDIVSLIEKEFHRSGRIIPVEEATKRWEEEALSGLEELYKIESVRQRLNKEPPKPQASKSSPEEQTPKTLSQRTMASVPKPQTLSADERRQRAIDVFYGRNL